jgi:hypothetical protein
MIQKKSRPKPVAAVKGATTPHSWSVEGWPVDVYPNAANRARYLVSKHRNDLLIAGALSRVGRELVVIGPRYLRWLESQAARVPDFEFGARRRQPHAGTGALD